MGKDISLLLVCTWLFAAQAHIRPASFSAVLAPIRVPACSGRTRLLRLRGGFDVWGDEDDEEEKGPVKAAGIKEVREAAREAAAKAAAFKSKSLASSKKQGGEETESRKVVSPEDGLSQFVDGNERGWEPLTKQGGEDVPAEDGLNYFVDNTKGKESAEENDGRERREDEGRGRRDERRKNKEGVGRSKSPRLGKGKEGMRELSYALEGGLSSSSSDLEDDFGMERREEEEARETGEVEGEKEKEEENDPIDDEGWGDMEPVQGAEMAEMYGEEDLEDVNLDDEDWEQGWEVAAPIAAPGKTAAPKKKGKREKEEEQEKGGEESHGSDGHDDLDRKALEKKGGETQAEEESSDNFEINPKWLLPQYRPAGWVEKDSRDPTKKAAAAAAAAAAIAEERGVPNLAAAPQAQKFADANDQKKWTRKDKKGSGKGDVEALEEGMSGLSVSGKGGALAKLVPLDKIELKPAGLKCNIDGSDDANYRYTMPTVSVKVEGTTLMIKTLVLNLEDLSQALSRPPEYIVTFLGQECHTMATIDHKEGIEGRAWVSGKHSQSEIQRLVFKFIRDTVLCRHCAGPETTVVVEGKKKKKTVLLDCKSCGQQSLLDSTMRFVQWMSVHPYDSKSFGWGQVRSNDRGEDAAPQAIPKAGKGASDTKIKAAASVQQQPKSANDQKQPAREEGAAGTDEPDTLEKLQQWKSAEAKRLKALLKKGALTDAEYQVEKMAAKDSYRQKKKRILRCGTSEGEGEDDMESEEGLTFTPGLRL